MNDKLSYYIKCLTHLRRDSKNGGAPHKPILLLSVIGLFEQGVYFNSEIHILPELVSSFKSHWSKLVETNHNQIFALPFYHMSSEPFWKLLPNLGCEKWIQAKGSMRSFSNLKTAIDYAIIDKELAQLLLEPDSRDILKIAVLERYFPAADNGLTGVDGDLPSGIILHESSAEYKQKILALKDLLDDNAFQEEVFVRSGIFKREIPKLYNNTCAISGLRIDATANISMVDACHIVPFSEAYDDSISNGIALCPNLHRAFDRGLISISDDYKVLLASNFVENFDSPYNLKQFEGTEINLPAASENYPSLEGLRWQRERFGD
jgi:putative restriction endonuclease